MNYVTLAVIFFALYFDRLNIIFYLLISALLHEFGHISACYLCKTPPKINISVFGIKLTNYPSVKYKKLFVILSGPLVNLLLFFVSHYIVKYKFSLKTYIFMCVNLVIGIFNLLPIYFLDGGQIVTTFVQNKTLRNIFDFISLLTIVITVTILSDNTTVSFISFIIFLVYYIINQNHQ